MRDLRDDDFGLSASKARALPGERWHSNYDPQEPSSAALLDSAKKRFPQHRVDPQAFGNGGRPVRGVALYVKDEPQD